MFEILEKEIEILNERLNSIKKYIIKNELEKRIIETKALEEFESIDLIEYRRLITEENKSPINYNAVIISLYGCYENFIDNILIDFLDPLIIAEKIATTERYKFITIDDVTKELRDGKKGVGGIGSNGRMVLV